MAIGFNRKKWVGVLWVLVILGCLFTTFVFGGIAAGWFGELPSFEELENPQSFLATEIYTADNVLLGKYYAENRSNVNYENLPEHLVNALVATEDERYYNHSGIDYKAVLRAVVRLGKDGGGSTITQQLAKNLFYTRSQSIERRKGTKYEYKPKPLERLIGSSRTVDFAFTKLKEWVLAVRLERSYTKSEIIAMYFNTVDFVSNSFGIKSASRTYFNSLPDSLSTEQSATLVGMLKGPSRYHPIKNPEAAKNRREVVLKQMKHNGFLSQESYDSIRALPLGTDYTPTNHIEGSAPYFREELRAYLHKWARENTKANGEPYDIYRDGLKIYTTIDSRMQALAEQALKAHLDSMQDLFWNHWKGRKNPWERYNQEGELLRIIRKTNRYTYMKDSLGMQEEAILSKLNEPLEMEVFDWDKGRKDTVLSPIDSIKYHRMHLQGGFLATDPNTGFIKAWVGGIDYQTFKYDHARESAKRQVGSTFKPFIYTLALRDVYPSACYKLPNVSFTFSKDDPKWNLLKDWTPQNSDGEEGGTKTIKQGLAQSLNIIAARLMYQLTPDMVVSFVRDLGITSKIEPYPSICLGTPDISLYEMVGAYTAFANKGIYLKPLFITRIEDKNGNLLESFYPDEREVMDEELAYVMLDLMSGVIDEPGATGGRIRWKYKLKGDFAGKTGTTQNNSDGWFMGITPDLVCGTWVGCDDRFVRFRSTHLGQGASLALPIYGRFITSLRADTTIGYGLPGKFEKPDFELRHVLDCSQFEEDDDTTTEDVSEPLDGWME